MISPQAVQDAIASIETHLYRGTTVVGCVLTLTNGHAVIGHSACAKPAEFDPKMGIYLARKDAEGKLAELLAFEARGTISRSRDAGH